MRRKPPPVALACSPSRAGIPQCSPAAAAKRPRDSTFSEQAAGTGIVHGKAAGSADKPPGFVSRRRKADVGAHLGRTSPDAAAARSTLREERARRREGGSAKNHAFLLSLY